LRVECHETTIIWNIELNVQHNEHSTSFHDEPTTTPQNH
jgi:hypothetical protein